MTGTVPQRGTLLGGGWDKSGQVGGFSPLCSFSLLPPLPTRLLTLHMFPEPRCPGDPDKRERQERDRPSVSSAVVQLCFFLKHRQPHGVVQPALRPQRAQRAGGCLFWESSQKCPGGLRRNPKESEWEGRALKTKGQWLLLCLLLVPWSRQRHPPGRGTDSHQLPRGFQRETEGQDSGCGPLPSLRCAVHLMGTGLPHKPDSCRLRPRPSITTAGPPAAAEQTHFDSLAPYSHLQPSRAFPGDKASMSTTACPGPWDQHSHHDSPLSNSSPETSSR